MKIGKDLVIGLYLHLSSWKGSDDPAPGNFTFGLDINGFPEWVLKEGSMVRFRSGPWNRLQFSGMPELRSSPTFKNDFDYNEKEVYYSYNHGLQYNSILTRAVVSPNGDLKHFKWIDQTQGWMHYRSAQEDTCDNYGLCGAYGFCNVNNSPVCTCLDGFVPKNKKEPGATECIRKTPLNCSGDGFMEVSGVKLPDSRQSPVNNTMNLEDCKIQCSKNCSCTAYANLDIRDGGSGCLEWFGELIDVKHSTGRGQSIYIRRASSELDQTHSLGTNKSTVKKKMWIIVSSLLFTVVIIVGIALVLFVWRKKHQKKGSMGGLSETTYKYESQKEDLELPIFDFVTIAHATNNFSPKNKIGEGGFGSVYKGILEDGQEIAVKRLSKSSRQGDNEFKNEVEQIAKVQHRNLVKLLGCCIQTDEKALIYEFMSNKSLDFFIFDETQSMSLDWPMRYHIIDGIARGLLYLHQDSRQRIIHRDLKAANILLDNEMNAKISDFGLARSFGEKQTVADTSRVVGTYGYMSPEYAIDGVYSIKSDVFSFGVLLLEIISGKRNRGFSHPDHQLNLVGHAWRLFTEGKSLELVAAPISDTRNSNEIIRSIHVGLLCVQQSPEDRPNMSNVVLMLSSEDPLPQPKQPVDTLNATQLIRDGETIVSADGRFELGFFSPGESRKKYLGIWYKQISVQTSVWVANRELPLNDSSVLVVINEKEVSDSYELHNSSILSRMVLSQEGLWERLTWVDRTQSWQVYVIVQMDSCDNYALCGAYGSCNASNTPKCSCLTGFVPKVQKNWDTKNWSNGCVRKTPLNCSTDGFLKYTGVKLPDSRQSWFNYSMNLEECKNLCTRNCSCTAYSNLDIRNGGSGCLLWFVDLVDIQQFTENGQEIYIRMAATELESTKPKEKERMRIAFISVLSATVLILGLSLVLYLWRKRYPKKPGLVTFVSESSFSVKNQKEDLELPLFDLATIVLATDNFSMNNKLGEGGFGAVYKGILKDGLEIAVKRLSESSVQGLDEFKNEVIHIAKLQHRNLVKILGCCIQADEKMLIYEFVPNKSLDLFIFDETHSTPLDWPMRYNIINGIARGLLYLHQDSRQRIIHRDLKAGNVLLDNEMNPKISDFGLARCFGEKETEANTKKVVGTYGYMAPEYAIDGLYSIKSDVFSYGVLVLEIVSGKRNRGFCHPDHQLNLLGHAWRLFAEGKSLELIASTIRDTCNPSEVLRSIHVGLLCVQQSPEDRPSMSNVVLMLGSQGPLPQPKHPGFFTERDLVESCSSSTNHKLLSSKDFTIRMLETR
ncbi:hypothetical protein REPUB_Repub05bG0047200 [Reevesia pubescens]